MAKIERVLFPFFCKNPLFFAFEALDKRPAFRKLQFFVNGNPDFAVIIFIRSSLFVFSGIVVILYAITRGKLVFSESGQPFGKYPPVYVLKRVGQRTLAREYSPVKRGYSL